MKNYLSKKKFIEKQKQQKMKKKAFGIFREI